MRCFAVPPASAMPRLSIGVLSLGMSHRSDLGLGARVVENSYTCHLQLLHVCVPGFSHAEPRIRGAHGTKTCYTRSLTPSTVFSLKHCVSYLGRLPCSARDPCPLNYICLLLLRLLTHGLMNRICTLRCFDQLSLWGMRWVDVRKADWSHRSRLVATDTATKNAPERFAATAPLKSLKYLLCRATQTRETSIMHLDVTPAYFSADARRGRYLRLLAENI